MANEITVASYLQYAKAAAGVPQTNYPFTNAVKTLSITGVNYQQGTFSVPTSAGGTAIPKGGVGTVGWIILQNLDPTNYVQVLCAASGTAFARLLPNEPPIVLRLDQSGANVPAFIANTAACEVAYLLIEN